MDGGTGESVVWDCIIVGAGIVGSWTAYHLSNTGQKILLLEQFMLPHSRGSSSGGSRLIRSAYNMSHHASAMPEAFQWWRTLEKDSNTKLYQQTGLLVAEKDTEGSYLDETLDVMKKNNLSHTQLTPEQMTEKYPQFGCTGQLQGVVDPSGGILMASRCLRVLQEQFQKKGGVIRDGEGVQRITPGTVVEVVTSKGTYLTKNVVLACGPWSTDILHKLGVDVPIKTMPGLNVFFKVRPSHQKQFSAESCPVFYTHLYYRPNAYRFVILFPSLEYPGMVKLITRGEPPPYYCHPDVRDTEGSDDLVKILVKFIKENLPGVDPTPCIMEPCVYSMTPDKDYIIDRHPAHPNIIIAAGFSGHGFKLAPVTGRLLSEMATHDTTAPKGLSHFRLSRL